MRAFALLASLGLVLTVAAGCVDRASDDDTGEPTGSSWVALAPPFEQSHDHEDPALHGFTDGLVEVGSHNLLPPGTPEAERAGYLNSEIIVRGDTAYVGWLGAPWALTVMDISNPAQPEFLGALPLTGVWAMDVAVSEDGEWAFLSIYNGAAVGSVFSQSYVTEAEVAPSGLAGPGVLVVDLRDKTNPRQAGFHPMHGLGPHTAAYHRHQNGGEYIFANKADSTGGDGIVILEVVFTPVGLRGLQPVAVYERGPLPGAGFPHDVDAQTHPITGATILYAAYWNQGLVLVDISDPTTPVTLGVGMPDDGYEVQIHDTHPYNRLIGGRHFTVSTPEIPTGADTGHMRIWETTDPAKPTLVGTYQIPGEWVVESDFDFSPHNFQFLSDGTIAWAHGHAGVWMLDWLTGAEAFIAGRADNVTVYELGYALPAPAAAAHPSWSPLVGTPWMWGVGIGSNDTVWALDISSGIHGYEILAPA